LVIQHTPARRRKQEVNERHHCDKAAKEPSVRLCDNAVFQAQQ
jgi:hypothetical protein